MNTISCRGLHLPLGIVSFPCSQSRARGVSDRRPFLYVNIHHHDCKLNLSKGESKSTTFNVKDAVGISMPGSLTMDFRVYSSYPIFPAHVRRDAGIPPRTGRLKVWRSSPLPAHQSKEDFHQEDNQFLTSADDQIFEEGIESFGLSTTSVPGTRRSVLVAAFAQTLLLGLTSLTPLKNPFLVSSARAEGVSSSGALVVPAVINIRSQPSSAFDPSDLRLRDAAGIFQNALEASTVEEEERLWTVVIEKYGSLDAEWVDDIVSRAWGNRGNARSRQGKLEEALEDYNTSIALAPYAIDPVLNRGVVLEALGRYSEAAADYLAVLEVSPLDPAAWNNLGNVMAATGRWDEAAEDYGKAARLAPEFSFASANYALALYQTGKDNVAIRQFRSLLRKYPEFPDMRAALAVSLYAVGLTAEAETNWARLEDLRYRDRAWVKEVRRWPPRLVAELSSFLDVKPSGS